jgi:outer membrane usher protein
MARQLRLRTATGTAALALLSPLPGEAAAPPVDCRQLGLRDGTQTIVQLREAGQPDRMAQVWRDAGGAHWFLPLAGPRPEPPRPDRASCTEGGNLLWRIAAADPALQHDEEAGLVSFVDRDRATAEVIDARRQRLRPDSALLDSLGLNYQLSANYTGSRMQPGAYADFYAYRGGWYFSHNLGLSPGQTSRFETYALNEDLQSGISLRLGDAVSAPTPQGESLHYAGVAWGTDRNLQPSNFAPVLPTLRSGSVVASPLDVYINDTLQYQRTLQSGVYDLRNIPAQQGFNSYSVRTVDALGNPVTVVREIYLPVSLLPPGISSWRIDAGWKRNNFISGDFRYGQAVLAATYARGVDYDTTLSGYALGSRDASVLSAGYDRRLSPLWIGHLDVNTARGQGQQGYALRVRAEGGGRLWRLFGEWLGAPRPLPSLAPDTAPLRGQTQAQAQWSGWRGVTLSLNYARAQRDGEAPNVVATLSATLRPFERLPVSLVVSLTRVRSASGDQKSLLVSAFMPLDTSGAARQSVAASYNASDTSQVSRLDYAGNNALNNTGWDVGLSRDAVTGISALDGFWSGTTPRLELQASGRTTQGQTDAQFVLRSGLLLTQGSVFATRPITGAFALVATGQEGLNVLQDNRPTGRTDARGMALVPNLRPYEANSLTLDPASWPINWNAATVEQQVVPPRGGGVMVSFKVSAQAWPDQSLLTLRDAAGQPFPPGSVVSAQVDGEERSTVVDRRGRIWLSELLPATGFSVRTPGRTCQFTIPPPDAGGQAPIISPTSCQDAP